MGVQFAQDRRQRRRSSGATPSCASRSSLDNTGSMATDGKMDALKTATKNLLDQLKTAAAKDGDVYVSIIPFSKDVNVGTSNYNAELDRLDRMGSRAALHGHLARQLQQPGRLGAARPRRQLPVQQLEPRLQVHDDADRHDVHRPTSHRAAATRATSARATTTATRCRARPTLPVQRLLQQRVKTRTVSTGWSASCNGSGQLLLQRQRQQQEVHAGLLPAHLGQERPQHLERLRHRPRRSRPDRTSGNYDTNVDGADHHQHRHAVTPPSSSTTAPQRPWALNYNWTSMTTLVNNSPPTATPTRASACSSAGCRWSAVVPSPCPAKDPQLQVLRGHHPDDRRLEHPEPLEQQPVRDRCPGGA